VKPFLSVVLSLNTHQTQALHVEKLADVVHNLRMQTMIMYQHQLANNGDEEEIRTEDESMMDVSRL
jgi:hypothetical protein